MKRLQKHSLHATVVLLIVIASDDAAYAYIDPSTGSYVLQLILAGILGAMFTLKLFWKRIRMTLSRLYSRIRRSENDDG